MEIKNELKAIDDIRGAIKRGYGYSQLREKLDVSEAEIVELGTKHPEFLNEINKRYKLGLTPKEKAPKIKEVAKKLPKKEENTVEKE